MTSPGDRSEPAAAPPARLTVSAIGRSAASSFLRRPFACVAATVAASAGVLLIVGLAGGLLNSASWLNPGRPPSPLTLLRIAATWLLAYGGGQLLLCGLALAFGGGLLAVGRRHRVLDAHLRRARRRLGPGFVAWALGVGLPVLFVTPAGLWWGLPVVVVAAPLVIALCAVVVGHLELLILDAELDPLAALGVAVHGWRRVASTWLALGGVAALIAGCALSLAAAVTAGAWFCGIPLALLLALLGAPALGLAVVHLHLAALAEAHASAAAGSAAPGETPLPLPGSAVSPWPERAAVALLFVSLGMHGPGAALVTQLAEVGLGLSPWMAATASLGLWAVPTIAAAAFLAAAHTRRRAASLDGLGVLLDVTEGWPGTRVPWERIAGFRITARGVMLRVRGQLWTRWWGPVLPCEDRLVHEVVDRLERRGIGPF